MRRMKGAVLLAILTSAALVTMGCEESPATKIANSPLLVMDFVPTEGGGTTKIYLRGASDHRFDRLTISIANRTLSDTNCMLLYMNTTLDVFNLTVEAVDGGSTFTTAAWVEKLPTLTRAFDIHLGETVVRVPMDDLPWVHRLDEA
ncbi:MAG TPA: hypothetical protein EYP43_02855 [Thermoplasmata archaeon]|nr:hypothetical protein [Thermoplasmata archaeon]